ncbi:MAG: tetratricopeptide repeat protein [Bacteroidales bacterium]|nr:tetratricopeptide repeat protein [Bacteroidales bacterium]
MKREVLVGIWMGVWFSLAFVSQGQESNRDYQYVLIEAVKQKNLGNLAEAVKLYNLVIEDRPDCAVAYYESGSIYLVTNQLELARKNLARAFEIDPGNEWYTLAFLNVLGALKEYEAARDILKKKIKYSLEKTEWEYKLAVTWFSMGREGKARRILEKIEREKGFSEKITLLKASIYESEEKYELAREEIEKVLAIFPEAIQFRVVAAELCLKSGDENAAAQYYMEILEVDSLNIFALTNLTDYYRQKEDFKSSYKYLAKSFQSDQIELNRKTAILSYYLSDEEHIHLYSKELGRVIDVFTETHPDESDIRLLAADFYIQNQEYAKAYSHLKHYLELQKGNYNIYMQTILLANAASMDEELIYMTGKALKMYPDSSDIRFFRGLALYQTAEYQLLINNFQNVSPDHYSSPEYASQAKMLMAEAYYRTDDFVKSDSLFEILIRQDPGNYMVMNNYSYYLAERGEKLEKAREWSAEVVRNNPDNATFLDTYAWVLYKLELYEEAEQYILSALDKGGENDPEINEHAGDIQLKLKSYQIARSYYMKALILGGDREKIEVKIQRIKNPEYE